jgi:hypothetical protein
MVNQLTVYAPMAIIVREDLRSPRFHRAGPRFERPAPRSELNVAGHVLEGLMSNMRVVGVLNVALTLSLFSACGGSSPAQPAPVPQPTTQPTAAPTPVPLALSVIPPCKLPASNPGPSASCTKPPRQLGTYVNAAIDRAINERPDLFNVEDVNGGPRILKLDPYYTAVVAALNESGVCGKIDAEGEIGVKIDNTFNEQYIIASRAGWGVPTSNYVERKYVGACSPSTF